MMELFNKFINFIGVDIIQLGFLLGFCFAAYAIPRFIVVRFIHKAIQNKEAIWDDIVLRRKLLNIVFTLPPVMVLYYGLQFFPAIATVATRFLNVAITIIVVLFLIRLIKTLGEIYESFPVAATRPIKGYVQLVEIFLILMSVILIICFFIDKSPWAILSGIGAMTAVLMLVFKETITSLVAGTIVASNKLVYVGDWIEVPGTEANGFVIEMALHTVRVRNFDNTIVTIPTHKLIDGSFINWRGMFESGGRRVKRSILIDQRSIRFLNDEDLERLMKIEVLKPYFERKSKELEEANKGVCQQSIANGRHLTNIGTFRAYVQEYLKRKKEVDKDKTFLIRHLAPTAEGLPFEVYLFANDTNWVNYEGIQADIFDHLLAVIHEFDLRVFQNPGGADISDLADKLRLSGRELL